MKYYIVLYFNGIQIKVKVFKYINKAMEFMKTCNRAILYVSSEKLTWANDTWYFDN